MTSPNVSRWLVPATLALAIFVFVLSSYPMVRPGFDVWWHLGAINAPEQLDPAAFPPRRIFWHHFWHWVFNLLQIQDHFGRALVIHRSQFLFTAFAIVLTSYLLLRVLTRWRGVDRGSLWTAACLSAVIWLSMNGTRSAAHGGGPGAEVTQSWMLWYSVNYQISLPLVLLAMALLLSAVGLELSLRVRWVFVTGFMMAIFVASLVHVAEVVYFLLFALFVVALYLRGRHAFVLAVVLSVGCLALAGLVLRHSYAVPRLLAFVFDGDVLGGLDAIRQEGSMLRGTGLTRIDTGWHALHVVSLAGLVVGALGLSSQSDPDSTGRGRWRAVGVVLLTGMFPLGLMFDLGAGLYSFLTHTYIAWRFSLASLIFIGVPFAALALTDRVLVGAGAALRQVVVVFLVAAVCGLAVWGEDNPERPSPGLAFGQSLMKSLHPEAMYFGLSEEQQLRLRVLSDRLKSPSQHPMLCTDIFTAYYLFFLERYPWVTLPPALEYLPEYRKADSDCAYPADNPTLRGMGMSGVQSGP